MDALKLFIPITKVDAAKRLVYGVATAEVEDRSGEVCDYATTKPYYEKWSGDIQKTTDGKSLGNLRSMHGHVAAGKLTAINFNDEAKKIEIAAKVVDDAEWLKVQEGVYTGFSQGGKYIKRWKDDAGLQRYTAEPSEVSLVDLPCLPTATFEMIKADGAHEQRHFKAAEEANQPSNDQVAAKAAELAKAAGDETKWGDYVEQARSELTKVEPMSRDDMIKFAKAWKAGVEIPRPFWDGYLQIRESDAADPLALICKAGNEKTPVAEQMTAIAKLDLSAHNTGPDFEQVWKSKRDGTTFKSKAELDAYHTKLDQDAAVKVAATPALDIVADIKSALGKKDFSDEDRKKLAAEGKAMKDGSFPIETKADLENAIKAYGRAKNKAAAKRHIIKRAKALGLTDLLPDDWNVGKLVLPDDCIEKLGQIEKGADLWSISDLLLLLDGVARMEDNAELPSFAFGNSVDLPKELCDRFGAALVELGDIAAEMLDTVLSSMKEEEASEALAAAAKIETMIKSGARHSKTDQGHIQKAHDAIVAAGAQCGAEKSANADVQKAASDLAAIIGERDVFKKALDQVTAQLAEIQKAVAENIERTKNIENQPAPHPMYRTVTKQEDDPSLQLSPEAALNKLLENPDVLAQLAIKAAQRNPQPLVPR